MAEKKMDWNKLMPGETPYDRILWGLDAHIMHMFVGAERDPVVQRTLVLTEKVRAKLRDVTNGEAEILEVINLLADAIDNLKGSDDKLDVAERKAAEQLLAMVRGANGPTEVQV